uniref:Uncharacterized protein n=1 Tax=Oryza punctata TaxID=4537 RepID=A0A0E0JGV7_ORYPU
MASPRVATQERRKGCVLPALAGAGPGEELLTANRKQLGPGELASSPVSLSRARLPPASPPGEAGELVSLPPSPMDSPSTTITPPPPPSRAVVAAAPPALVLGSTRTGYVGSPAPPSPAAAAPATSGRTAAQGPEVPVSEATTDPEQQLARASKISDT